MQSTSGHWLFGRTLASYNQLKYYLYLPRGKFLYISWKK